MKFLSSLFSLFTLILFPVSPVYASPSLFTVSQPPNFSINSIGLFIATVARLLLIIGAILVFIYLLWGGMQWITSGGDAAATKEARDKITAAIIGLAILALSVAITLIIQYFFGITIIGNIAAPIAY